MKLLRKFIHSLSNQEPRILGRWKLENCIRTINNKVDLANEDHCGICQEYRLAKVNDTVKQTEQDDISEDDEYIRYMM